MIRVVCDTNILVSAVLKSQGNEAAVLDAIAAGEVQLCASEPILAEYAGVLARPKFGLDPARVRRLVEFLRAAALVLEPAFRLAACPHEPDNRFLECAEAAQADYLVTGNQRHFPARWKITTIVNAGEFWRRQRLPHR